MPSGVKNIVRLVVVWVKIPEPTRFTKDSDVILFKVFSTPMVILNTHKAATDLLTKRWTKYSDRLDLPMANDLCV